ncbi:MAG: YbjN domain-containing protein [Chlorobium limicola]|nr:YbjN domain-containing protein [Chlorobium limicola]
MRLAQLLEAFIADIGWKDQLEIIEDEGISRLAVRLSVGNRSYRLMLEGYEMQHWLVLCLYAPFTVRASKFVDACMLFNFINSSYSYSGNISVADDGIICYKQIVDLDDTGAEIALIYNMLHAAVNMYERNADEIEDVAVNEARYEDVRKDIERKTDQSGLTENEG